MLFRSDPHLAEGQTVHAAEEATPNFAPRWGWLVGGYAGAGTPRAPASHSRTHVDPFGTILLPVILFFTDAPFLA